MRYLIERANEYGLSTIVEQAMAKVEVHGVMVDIHPWWLLLKAEGQNYNSLGLPKYIPYFHFPGLLQMPYWNAVAVLDNSTPMFVDPAWSDFFKYRSNLIVKILLRPGSKPIEINYEGRLTIFQENRPVPRLSSSKSICRPVEGGVSIGYQNDGPGTLGGILVDPQGTFYGLTCGHVINGNGYIVDQPSRIDSPNNYSTIGQTIFVQKPIPNNGARCNRHNPTLNDMDVALIKLDSTIQCNLSILGIGKIDGHTPGNQMHPNLLVDYTGRTSGNQSLALGGIGVIQEIADHAGQTYCMKELIEVKRPTLGQLVLHRPAQGGDSGAWLVTQGTSGTEWCGMIVAEERQTGYAIEADSVLQFLAINGFPALNCC